MTQDNTNLSQDPEFAELDALFARAATTEPVLHDENFTKIVVNRLPINPSRAQRKAISFDVVGVIIGVIAAYFMFDFGQFWAVIVDLIPEYTLSIDVSQLIVMGAISLFGFTGLAGWFAMRD